MASPGGFFPFSQKSFPIHLGSGGTYAVPPGNYMLHMGRVSVLQVMDGYSGLWRNHGGPFSRSKVSGSDGANYRIVNFSGIIQGAKITTAGSGGTNGIGATATGAAISFGATPSTGRAASGYCVVGGSINSTITITTAGTGLTVPPMLVFDPPPAGGIPATAYCTLSSGTVGAVTVTNPGAGYTGVPNCYVIPQWGTYPGGAIAGVDPPSVVGPSANIMALQLQGLSVGAWTTMPVLTVNSTLAGSGTLTAIVMLDYGANYVSAPAISFTGAPTSAAASAIMALSLTGVTTSNAGVAVSVLPGWTSNGGIVQAHDGNNDYLTMIPAFGTTVLSGTTVSTTTVESPGFGIQSTPTISYLPSGGTAWTTFPTGAPITGGVADTCIVQPSVSS